MRVWRSRIARLAVLPILMACGACSTSHRTGALNARPASVPLLRLAAGPGGFPSPITGRRQAAVEATLLFDTLVWKDAAGTVIPWLAASWQKSADGTQWTFTLRDGVRWHDGSKLTSDDVAFSYNYYISGPGHAAAGIFGSVFVANFKNVEAMGASTIVFHLVRPWAPFLVNIVGLVPILPKHIWATVADPANFAGPTSVMGSGPYRLKSFDIATGSADFVANDDYFLGKPFVRRIEFVPAPDQLLALRRGAIDAADAGHEDQLPTRALKDFSSSQYGTVTGPSDWNRTLHFNLSSGFPYNDVRFRQAVAYAIDRPDLVHRVLFGHGMPGDFGLMAPSSPYFEPGLPSYDYNPAMAKSLLDQIGLTAKDGNPTRALPDGRAFTITLQTSSQFSGATAQIVSENLRKVGLAVSIQALDPITADSNARQGKYDMALVGYGGVTSDPDGLLRIGMSPKTIAVTFKAIGYDSQEVEALGAQQLFTNDDAARVAVVRHIERLVANDVPIISLYLPTPAEIYNRNVFSDWFVTPGGFLPTASGVLNKLAFTAGHKAAP